ncbi:unnamed protein product [Paramecium sonneborni]|uniref:Uncharacterized protein n=1 Tax=Paramecium sonneborni TaxID=65129 RepID=A0A8S1Q507_9CILI|nr:unnamed protein product [Paramecium sonneborni]
MRTELIARNFKKVKIMIYLIIKYELYYARLTFKVTLRKILQINNKLLKNQIRKNTKQIKSFNICRITKKVQSRMEELKK